MIDVMNILNQNEQDLLNKINILTDKTSVENWDDEYAPIIQKEQWAVAEAFVLFVFRTYGFAPFISACGDKTIHLSYKNNRGILEIGDSNYWWTNDSCVLELSSLHKAIDFILEL